MIARMWLKLHRRRPAAVPLPPRKPTAPAVYCRRELPASYAAKAVQS